MQAQVMKFGGWLLRALSQPEVSGAHFSVGITVPMLTEQSWPGDWE